jgi:hypothetical protein
LTRAAVRPASRRPLIRDAVPPHRRPGALPDRAGPGREHDRLSWDDEHDQRDNLVVLSGSHDVRPLRTVGNVVSSGCQSVIVNRSVACDSSWAVSASTRADRSMSGPWIPAIGPCRCAAAVPGSRVVGDGRLFRRRRRRCSPAIVVEPCPVDEPAKTGGLASSSSALAPATKRRTSANGTAPVSTRSRTGWSASR